MSVDPTYFPAGAKEPVLTLTRPTPKLWVVELHNAGAYNVLSLTFINDAICPALDLIEQEWRKSVEGAKAKGKSAAPDEGNGAVIIIGKRNQNQFFSIGIDFTKAIGDPNQFFRGYNPMMKRLLTFPIPVVAAINGNCFAGGMMFALCCDYRVMTDGEKPYMSMSEVHIGAPWPPSFASTLMAKVGDANLRRKIALEGQKFAPKTALAAGLVDQIASGDSAEAVLNKARELAELVDPLAKGGVWGLIKEDLYRDALGTFELPVKSPPDPVAAAAAVAAMKARM